MLTAEGNACSRNLLWRFGNVVEFPLQHAVFFHCLLPSFSFIIIIFYHSYHKNNSLSRKDESFLTIEDRISVTAYDRDINK